jgi:hypothetical protein
VASPGRAWSPNRGGSRERQRERKAARRPADLFSCSDLGQENDRIGARNLADLLRSRLRSAIHYGENGAGSSDYQGGRIPVYPTASLRRP